MICVYRTNDGIRLAHLVDRKQARKDLQLTRNGRGKNDAGRIDELDVFRNVPSLKLFCVARPNRHRKMLLADQRVHDRRFADIRVTDETDLDEFFVAVERRFVWLLALKNSLLNSR
jgi:hypothetical protein